MSENAVATTEQKHPIEIIKGAMTKRADEFKAVLPSHISVEKFQRTVATAALSNPQLLQCDRQSFMMAAMKAAQDGLLPDGREAALVPFKKRVKGADGRWYDSWQVQFFPMVYGQRKKILQSGEVISLQVGVVYAAEVAEGAFIYEIGMEPPIRHRPKLDMTEEEMADNNLVAAYSIAKIKNGDGEPVWSVEVMRRAEVLKVRNTSQTGALNRTKRDGSPIPPSGPWVDWEPEMWKKTVLKRHSKVLPMSGDILDSMLAEDEEELKARTVTQMLETEERTVALPDNFDEETGEVIDNEDEQGNAPAPTSDDASEATAPDGGSDTASTDGTATSSSTSSTSSTATSSASPTEEPKTDPATGMTEVDEETARQLDAEGGDSDDSGWDGDEEPEAEEAADEAPEAADEAPVWQQYADEVQGLIDKATGRDSWQAAENAFIKHAAGFPDDVAKKLDVALQAKRGELQGGGKK